jgi:hypothetical protein
MNHYLGLDLPEPWEEKHMMSEAAEGTVEESVSASSSATQERRTATRTILTSIIGDLNAQSNNDRITAAANEALLDMLPNRFDFEPQVLYSHFAQYDYNSIHHAEGKHQVAMLHQQSDLFHRSRKELCYYYLVPRLYEAYNPSRCGSTVTDKTVEI